MGTGDLAAQLDRVRLESDTLYDVIGAIASAPDLDGVLAGVVDVLTKATRCHACFVYLRAGERLRLRAASRVYAHLVGQVEFGVDEGLTGWALRRNEPAFIRENALDDPRTVFVPELEEERFQSMVAVPIPARDGAAIGVIVLHTIAPREFDDGTLTMLAHTAPLVAGSIENAQLYEDARRRVAALTALSALSQRIAGVEDRADLYRAASEGVRTLLGCAQARLYALDAERDGRLELVAADPPRDGEPPAPAVEAVEISVPVAAGEERLGLLVAAGSDAFPEESEELLRAVANQVAVALKKAELIERLTEENIVRDLFTAFERGELAEAQTRARQARCDLDGAHVFVHVEQAGEGQAREAWPPLAEHAESGLRRLVPGALCDAGGKRVRALLPLEAGGTAHELQQLDGALARLGAADGTAIGRSDVHRGAVQARGGLREAADAARVAASLVPAGGALAYAELGAYRYLVTLVDEDAPDDPYLEAVRTIAAYDARRGSQLVATLERYLTDRRSVTETARALTVHPNTLRQRLERIETITGLSLAEADLLALELAVKLARLRPES
ncbi:MAG TPA: GAF domain-containing protein [Conexibacter sp.]|nr:GAF domain-containing protein [Conexibacter sp.]